MLSELCIAYLLADPAKSVCPPKLFIKKVLSIIQDHANYCPTSVELDMLYGLKLFENGMPRVLYPCRFLAPPIVALLMFLDTYKKHGVVTLVAYLDKYRRSADGLYDSYMIRLARSNLFLACSNKKLLCQVSIR